MHKNDKAFLENKVHISIWETDNDTQDPVHSNECTKTDSSWVSPVKI
jgi:hypothetical protein